MQNSHGIVTGLDGGVMDIGPGSHPGTPHAGAPGGSGHGTAPLCSPSSGLAEGPGPPPDQPTATPPPSSAPPK